MFEYDRCVEPVLESFLYHFVPLNRVISLDEVSLWVHKNVFHLVLATFQSKLRNSPFNDSAVLNIK